MRAGTVFTTIENSAGTGAAPAIEQRMEKTMKIGIPKEIHPGETRVAEGRAVADVVGCQFELAVDARR